MTNPKMQPCPRCGSAEGLAVFRYDSGARHVECDNGGCQYLGPGEGSIRAAIKAHNLRMSPAVANAMRVFEDGLATRRAFEAEARFPEVSCSQCGQAFGPGDSGFSHCDQHTALAVVDSFTDAEKPK